MDHFHFYFPGNKHTSKHIKTLYIQIYMNWKCYKWLWTTTFQRLRNSRHGNSAYQLKNYSWFNFRRHLVTERNREELDEVSNRRLTSMALDVSRGLSYLAELKYVHRDVACRNCLVNSSRVVKLADFGMTRPMYENDYYRFSRKGI